jgi:adenosylhomocysteine nucleosidase
LPPLGIITGLIGEAHTLAGLPVPDRPSIFCSGANSARALEGARTMVSNGCAGLLSFGMAGGLEPGLDPGAVVVPDAVIAPGGKLFKTDKAWRQSLRAALGPSMEVSAQPLVGSGTLVTSVAAKKSLYRDTDAVAVDMESHAVARAARDGGVPFLALRVIADPADRAVPEWIVGAISEGGRPRPGRILAGLLIRPWDVGVLIGLAGDSRKALTRLSRVALLAGPRFGFG